MKKTFKINLTESDFKNQSLIEDSVLLEIDKDISFVKGKEPFKGDEGWYYSVKLISDKAKNYFKNYEKRID